VSRYQKGKSNLDFTEARHSEWQWYQLGCMQVYTSLQTDNHASTPPLSFLLSGRPSCRPTNSIKALKAKASFASHVCCLELNAAHVFHVFQFRGNCYSSEIVTSLLPGNVSVCIFCVLIYVLYACVFICFFSSFVRFMTSESREKALQEATAQGFTYNGAKLFVRMPK